ncbi:hypothetical protein [Corallococcus aberystwythensis]|uniref:Uncharacterized protein n=1 Tax=Corallococcus aberystwythensis TaxID=2316722 RepID=A0A3A8QRG0_9BACT|nr:hypothetical protein [Corallococcus aberystwythensis]RKH71137.1 hypothetical protein D7W81_08060 [Corallococcus aberystwythensis]
MGVHDYRCSVCGPPSSFECGEKTGKECEEEGIGNDEAILDLFFFAADEAPEDVESFEEARGRARRTRTQPFGYDWGEWEFVPSLNYRELLMDDDDATGVWCIEPFDEDASDGSPVSLEIPEGERVWVVNYCPICHPLFAEGKTPADEPCLEYLRAIAENLDLDFDGVKGSADKPRFIATVRERVARRRPVTR